MLFTKKQQQAIQNIISEMNLELDKIDKKQINIINNYRNHQDKRKIKIILEKIVKM